MAVNYSAYYSDPLQKVMQGEDYISRIAKGATQRQAGQQYAAGNYRGAATTLAESGDIGGAQTVEAQATKQAEALRTYIQQAVPYLQQIYAKAGPQAMMQAVDSLWPTFEQARVPRATFDQYRQQIATNPEMAFQMLGAMPELVFQKGGNGQIYAINKATGQPVGEPIGDPTPQRPIVLPQGADLVVPNAGGTATQIPVQPQTGGAPLPVAPTVGGAAPAPINAGAPVPPQVPQTAAAPAVIPQAVPPAAGAVQPQAGLVRPGAMPGATQPPRAQGSPTRALPPLSAPASAGAGYGDMGNVGSGVASNAGGFGAPAVPEGTPARAMAGSGYEIAVRGRTKPPASAAGGFSAAFTPDAVDYAANQYMITGKMPPLGAGAAGARAQIIARAAQIAKERGLSFNQVAGSQAERTANASALTQIVKYTNMAESFAETMRKSAQYARTLVREGAAQSGSPLANRGIQWWRQNVQGDPKVAAFNTAINTLVTEYAKIMSGNTGAAGATEGARQHARELLDTALTPDQFESVIAVLDTEVRLRREALTEQAAALRASLSGPSVTTSPGAATQPGQRQPTLEERLQKYR